MLTKQLLTKFIPALNWYAIAAKVMLCLLMVSVTWMEATHRCEIKHEHAQTIAQTRKLDRVTHEVARRVPEVQKQTQQSTQKQEHVNQTGKNLDEANKANPTGGCNLTPNQLRLFRELAQATKR